VGDAVLSTKTVAGVTITGTVKLSSHTHFDFVSGSKSNASVVSNEPVMLQVVPWLLCQLVQLGSLNIFFVGS